MRRLDLIDHNDARLAARTFPAFFRLVKGGRALKIELECFCVDSAAVQVIKRSSRAAQLTRKRHFLALFGRDRHIFCVGLADVFMKEVQECYLSTKS